MSVNREQWMDRRKIELRMKRIWVTGLVLGLVIGGGIAFWIGGVFGNGKKDSREREAQNAKQENAVPGNVEVQVIDTVEVAKLNAESLVSEKDKWKLTLVNSFYPLAKDYVPKLVEIEQDKLVDERIAADLQQMLSDARAAGLNPYICSAYRDYGYQRQVFNETMVQWISNGYAPLDAYEETAKSVAIPGTSEHATGLALDITSAEFTELDERQAGTAEAKWLAENCWKYGFILRYPPDKSDITGIIYEPWHYRYVGKEAAKDITEKGVTLEEYLGK
ncbi:M15 family metallopeptidase [Mediterraneibacter agrestimuris]|uniref:M15 family metallopeptidase n=1 Tax=Mediterraneibacter agrestimuris TaxID=2941333 RepID=UPI00203DE068|nr:M15 family metallopeptidase [Mediterraneibacter agrestimuris]